MGYGDYSHEAHEAITAARATRTREDVFKQRECHPLMNPKGVRVRESRDSPEHPSSLAIAFALDVTGSMGAIPDLLARQKLPKFMKVLGDCGVPDPQILFLGVGDATCDRAPLQVGQFESTAELIDQWLTWSFLEGGGGGGDRESYELALYFLAQHVDLDCVRKRKRKGYAFLTGDENPYPAVSKHQVETLIGDVLDDDVPLKEVVAACTETFHPFFLIPDLARRKRCERTWRDVLGDHVIAMEAPEDTCFVAASVVALGERQVADLDAMARRLEGAGAPRDRIGPIVRALEPFAAALSDRPSGGERAILDGLRAWLGR
jgi:hypothetical protein